MRSGIDKKGYKEGEGTKSIEKEIDRRQRETRAKHKKKTKGESKGKRKQEIKCSQQVSNLRPWRY